MTETRNGLLSSALMKDIFENVDFSIFGAEGTLETMNSSNSSTLKASRMILAGSSKCFSWNRRHWNQLVASVVCVGLLALQTGCESHTSGVTQTDTKTQMERLFNLYKSYVDAKKKGPPNEQALRDFAKTLSEKELDDQSIGKDLDGIFVSPRDKEPFQIVWGQNLNPGGNPIAVIYEKTGEKGMKYVALSMGYTEEYANEDLSEYLPKKK